MKTAEKAQRNLEIYELRKRGKLFREIGKIFGISQWRCIQIYRKQDCIAEIRQRREILKKEAKDRYQKYLNLQLEAK